MQVHNILNESFLQHGWNVSVKLNDSLPLRSPNCKFATVERLVYIHICIGNVHLKNGFEMGKLHHGQIARDIFHLPEVYTAYSLLKWKLAACHFWTTAVFTKIWEIEMLLGNITGLIVTIEFFEIVERENDYLCSISSQFTILPYTGTVVMTQRHGPRIRTIETLCNFVEFLNYIIVWSLIYSKAQKPFWIWKYIGSATDHSTFLTEVLDICLWIETSCLTHEVVRWGINQAKIKISVHSAERKTQRRWNDWGCMF